MKMKIFLVGLLILALAGPAAAQTAPAYAQTAPAAAQATIVPYPQELSVLEGAYHPAGKSLQVMLALPEGGQRRVMEEELREMYAKRWGAQLSFDGGKKADIIIGIPSEDSRVRELALKMQMMPGDELGAEGYMLLLEQRKVFITAGDAAGLFYGVQSLKQHFRGTPAESPVYCLRVRDWPDLDFRCIMDDISRGPIPTREYLKEQVRRYAEMKINGMSFYIEHVVQTRAYPDIAPMEGGISVEEFAELADYAADYHIQLVGNFQSLGHFEKILSLPQFRHLGSTERMLDPLNPASLEFLEEIYSEMAPAFSSPYFTPNLDEAWDLSRGGLKGAAAELGPAKIYADHARAIDSLLRMKGKKTMIWGDIVLEHPEILEMLPKDIIMGAWNYSPSESFADYIDPLRDAGFDFTIAPGVLNSRRLVPDFRMSTTNIRNFINEGHEKGALGVYCTVWDDGGLHFFSHDWYGLAYNAEQSWRPNREPLAAFDRRFNPAIYGDPSEAFTRSLHTLNHLTDLGPTFEMNSNVFYKALVPERGSKVSFDAGSWIPVKMWADSAAALLESAAPAVYGGDLDFFRFTIEQYRFMADSREDLLAASEAYARACSQQRDDRDVALEQLNLARELCGGLESRMDALAQSFLELWDRESRAYWRDRARADFAVHQQAFADQSRLLAQASRAFAGGAYLPPPTEVRLDIRPKTGQFFQYWLLSGPFHLERFEDYAPDFLQSMGGEAAARPFPGMRFKGSDGKEYSWNKYDAPRESELDFTEIFNPNITAAAYAYCSIDVEEDMEVTGLLGSNDGATVWLNGDEVHHVHGKRSLIPDEDEIPMKLRQGRNHLLIKVEQWKGGWGLSFRLDGVEIRNHKQKYYIQ